tara:strand:+ start:82 stop:807 length:726 start_codon:yes stop_codon:yes gene_type:complete
MLKKKILLYGLYRTGTNYLQALLSDNFHIEHLNHAQEREEYDVCHKHARLYCNSDFASGGFKCFCIRDFEDLKARIKKNNPFPDFFVITSKDPYSWLLSFRAFSEWDRRYKNLKFHPIKEYSLYYKKLISLSKQGGNFIFVRYIDMISNINNVERLGQMMNLEKKVENITNIKKNLYMNNRVPFSEDRRRFYMDKLYLDKLRHDASCSPEGYYFRQDHIEEINRNLDEEVVEYLGYKIEQP